MLKISDILKKTKKIKEAKSVSSEKKTADKEVPKKDAELKKTAQDIKREELVKQQHAEKEPPSGASLERSLHENNDNQRAVRVYKEAISLSEQLGGLSSRNWGAFAKNAKKIINEFLDIFESDENALLRLFFGDYYSFNGYLYQHSVNVCVLSLYISRFIKYSRDQLQQIGLAAMLHDVGLVKYDDLISQNKRFGAKEYDEVKKHPIAGRNIMEKIDSDISREILDVISQEHERLDGSGYPYALKENEISEKARLIGLVDSYESMMHVRPYRNKFKSEEVIKYFTQYKARFDYKFIKVLIDLVGVFPVTTVVKLNTREIGVVVKQNYQMPLKPVVKVTHSAQGQKIGSPKAVDLASNFSIYIQECFVSRNVEDEKNGE